MYDIARTIFFFFSFRWGKKKGLEPIRKWMRLAAAIMKAVIVETTHVRKGSAEARRGGRGAAPSGCGGARQGRVVTRRSWGSVTARRYLRTPNRTPSPSLCEATCLWFRGKDRTSGTWGRVLSSERIQPARPQPIREALNGLCLLSIYSASFPSFFLSMIPPPFVFYGAACSYAND